MKRPGQQGSTIFGGVSCNFVTILWTFITLWVIFIAAVWYSGHISVAISTPGERKVSSSSKDSATSENEESKKFFVSENQQFIAPPKHVGFTTKEQLMHIVFSTDCSYFQDWQTLLVFNSAVAIKQPGIITRIASGCSPQKQEELKALYAKLYPQYDIHFTPDFKKDAKTGKSYDFYNKPYGLKHWLEFGEHLDHTSSQEVIIALIDPDFIFLRPLTVQVRQHPSSLYMKNYDPAKFDAEIPDVVTQGHPIAQYYGLGAPWTYDKHKNFNRTRICGAGSPCLDVKPQFGGFHFR